MDTLFQNVLTMSLSAGFLAAVVMGLRWFLKSSPKWVHCALWALVAVRLMLPSLPQSQLSMVPERVSDPEVIVQMMDQMPAFVPLPTPEDSPMPEISNVELPAVPTPVVEAEPLPTPVNWMALLGWVWIGGVMLMGSYAAFSYLRLRRRVAASVDIGNRVRLCDYVDTPFILGLFRPWVYLPSGLDSKTAAYVLAHEQAHLQRRDHWWKPLGFVLLSIHWFNPMIWAAYVLLCRDIEMACDEAVIRTMDEGEKIGYSGALLRCSLPRHLISFCPLAFGEVGVKQRIRSVLNYRKPALWLTLLAVIAVGASAVLFLTDPAGPEGEVKYYQTAFYNSSSDYLEITEYDKEFREISQKQYDQGLLYASSETSYTANPASPFGKGRRRTVTYTVDPKSLYTICPEEGIDVPPGQSATLVYAELLDENGNLTSSTCTSLGLMNSWNAIYDAKGNKINEAREWEKNTRKTTYTYDENGNVLTKESVTDGSDHLRDYERLDKFTYNDRGEIIGYQLYTNGNLTLEEATVWNGNGRKRSMVRSGLDATDSIYSYSYDETGLVETCEVSWPDGTVYSTYVTTYDAHGNTLSQIYRSNGAEFGTYYNYIGTDGSKSIGVPREVYAKGQPVTAHPLPDQALEPQFILEPQNVTPAGCILKVKVTPRYQSSLLSVGNRFTLERKIGETWEQMKPLAHNLVQWTPQPLGQLPLVGGYYTMDYSVSWARLYGILPPGRYRLTTSLSDYYSADCSAEFTVEENESDVREREIQRCMDALNELVNNQMYHVEIVDDQGHRNLYAQYTNHWLHLSYSSPTTRLPVGGEMMLGGRRYIKMQGAWAINEGAPEKALTDWFEEFVFDHNDLSLLRCMPDMGIGFGVDYRPGKELPQKHHCVYFQLDDNGHLTGIREEGVITEYDGQAVEQPYSRTLTVVSTEPEILEEVIAPEEDKLSDKSSYNTFSWENDKKDVVGGAFIDGGNYANKEPHPIERPGEAYYLAKQELYSNLAVRYGIVTRDEQAKMWRVEFRYQNGSAGFVYLDDDGITQWVKMTYPAHLSPDVVDSALSKCWAVLYEVQSKGCYGIETTFAYSNRNNTGESTVRSWKDGNDWLESITAPVSDVPAVRMYRQGELYENDHVWGRNYQRFSGVSAGSLMQFVPWLISTRWEDYNVVLLDESGPAVQLLLRPKAGDGDEYSVTFHFDGDTFQFADIETRSGGITVSTQSTRIITLVKDEVSEKLDQQADRFAKGSN